MPTQRLPQGAVLRHRAPPPAAVSRPRQPSGVGRDQAPPPWRCARRAAAEQHPEGGARLQVGAGAPSAARAARRCVTGAPAARTGQPRAGASLRRLAAAACGPTRWEAVLLGCPPPPNRSSVLPVRPAGSGSVGTALSSPTFPCPMQVPPSLAGCPPSAARLPSSRLDALLSGRPTNAPGAAPQPQNRRLPPSSRLDVLLAQPAREAPLPANGEASPLLLARRQQGTASQEKQHAEQLLAGPGGGGAAGPTHADGWLLHRSGRSEGANASAAAVPDLQERLQERVKAAKVRGGSKQGGSAAFLEEKSRVASASAAPLRQHQLAGSVAPAPLPASLHGCVLQLSPSPPTPPPRPSVAGAAAAEPHAAPVSGLAGRGA